MSTERRKTNESVPAATPLHVHALTGCAPAPLAYYLKALGVLRLVAEQKDPEARGWWQDEHFRLMTRLSREELETFFLDEYQPSPFVSPWNKGSGFFAEKDAALEPVESSTAARFEFFREGIQESRRYHRPIALADAEIRRLKDLTKATKGMSAKERAAAKARKDDPEFKAQLAAANREFEKLKAELFGLLSLNWRGLQREWMNAAFALEEGGKPVFAFLLGTGGNDGRIDFTNNAMKRMADIFDLKGDGAPTRKAPVWLEDALWGNAVDAVPKAPVGQFLPGNAGGANSGEGPGGDARVNPWNFVLMLEGAFLFGRRATRRYDQRANASAPFSLRFHPIGFGSAGGENATRGEQWLPLWSRPSRLTELRSLLGEARMQVGRAIAERPVDGALAIAQLGVARGIEHFLRYGYLERNGQSNFAVPLSRIDVRLRPHASHIDDAFTRWLRSLSRQASSNQAPTRLVHAERRLADAVFASLTHDESAQRWQAILFAAVDIEALQVSGTARDAGPIPPLSPEWLDAADDGSAEWRLACALGSAHAYHGGRSPSDEDGELDPVRVHWLPLDERGKYTEKSEPRQVFSGRDPLGDLIAVVERRIVEAANRGERVLSLDSAYGFGALPEDLAAFLAGDLDDDRISKLSRALMALRWEKAPRPERARATGREPAMPDDAWIALRLAHPSPRTCSLERLLGAPNLGTIAVDPAAMRRLASGDGSAALRSALHRLRAAGMRPPLRGVFIEPEVARRWAAALAFPIGTRTAKRFSRSFVVETGA